MSERVAKQNPLAPPPPFHIIYIYIYIYIILYVGGMSGGKRKRGGERGGATSELRYPVTPPLGRGGEGRGGVKSEARA